MSDSRQYRVNLVQDTPALKDDFGAHARLADAIAELIDSHDGGISIGLEGGWGSGKSTVVNLVKEKYEKKDSHSVVLFDAWAHQGDPLRRTFLETIIKRLIRLGWVDKNQWDKTRDELAQRRRITDVKSIPRLGKLGSLLALGVLLIPVGLALLNAGLGQPSGTTSADWMPIAGIILTLIPVGILIVPFLWRVVVRIWKGIRRQPVPPNFIFADFGALIAQRYVTDTRTETIESPNPTSVEFEETFTRLMAEALSGKQRRLILALDNLDRVTSSDALSILAALQTFLRHSEHDQPDWFKRLYVLIPYDSRGIQGIWRTETKGDENSVALAFLDKTFQLRFEVPPLLLSDWRSYLINLLKQALPDHDETEFHSVYRLFALQSNRDNIWPTPRTLKLFVNQIGTINRQWKNAFPLVQVAYYVILRRKQVDVSRGLLERNVPELELISLLGGNSHDNLAAMAFNVSISQARQLLLRSPIEKAIGDRDVSALQEQSTYPGFWEIFQDIPFDDWAENESIQLANSAFCLDSGSLLTTAEPTLARMVINSLKSAASQVKLWAPFNPESALGMSSLIRLSPDALLAKHMLQSLPPIIPDLDRVNTTRGTVWPWTSGLIELLKTIKTEGIETAYSDGIGLEVNADVYIELCSQIYTIDTDAEFWSVLYPEFPIEELTSSLSTVVSNEGFSTKHINAIRVIRHAKLEVHWDKVITEILKVLRSGTVLAPHLIVALLTALQEVRALSPITDAEISQFALQGHILHHLHHIRSDPTAAAWCIFIFLQGTPAATEPQPTGNSQDGFNFLNSELFGDPQKYVKITDRLVDLLASIGQLRLLFTILDASPASKAWILDCLKRVLLTEKYIPVLFAPPFFMQRWKFLTEELPTDDYSILIAFMVEHSGLIQYLCDQDFDPQLSELYTVLVQESAVENHAFYEWCQRGLREVDVNTWQQEFINEKGSLVELVIDLFEKGVEISLGTAYQDALLENGKAVITGTTEPDYLRDYWATLFKPLGLTPRKLLRTQLLRAAGRADGKIAPAFFEFYGDEIADHQILWEDSDVVLNVFIPLLQERNAKGLDWLDRVFAAHIDLLERYNTTHVDGFKARLQQAIDDEEHIASSSVVNIGRRLGIQRKEVSDEEEKE